MDKIRTVKRAIITYSQDQTIKEKYSIDFLEIENRIETLTLVISWLVFKFCKVQGCAGRWYRKKLYRQYRKIEIDGTYQPLKY